MIVRGFTAAILAAGFAVWIGYWHTLWCNLPFLYLVNRHLVGPNGTTIIEALGIRVERKRWSILFGLVVSASALQFGLGTLLQIIAASCGAEIHWAEIVAFEGLLHGSPASVLAEFIDGVVWAPLFEEVGFRGVLYVTLRTNLRPTSAALTTAGVFAFLHLYSPIGFGMVAIGALVEAWLYENTRSLLPSILCHALNNMFAFGGLLLIYR